MKTTFTFLLSLLISVAAFCQQDTIVKWTFPTGEMTDIYPDFANSYNVDKTIFTEGGTSAIEMKNGATTKAAQATGWDSGQGTKSWQIEVNLTGKYNVQVSSKQSAGGNEPGPKDFKMQYRIGSEGTWGDISYGTVVVTNDWTTGFKENIAIPIACDNQPSVYIRWLMMTNLSINGANVIGTGKAKIDDIIVTGTATASVNEIDLKASKIYPNPCTTNLNVKSDGLISEVEIYSITGNRVYQHLQSEMELSINTESLTAGYYILKLIYSDGFTETRKIMVK